MTSLWKVLLYTYFLPTYFSFHYFRRTFFSCYSETRDGFLTLILFHGNECFDGNECFNFILVIFSSFAEECKRKGVKRLFATEDGGDEVETTKEVKLDESGSFTYKESKGNKKGADADDDVV